MLRNSLFVIAFCGLLVSCSRQELELREADGVIRLGVGKVAASRAEVQTATDLGNNIGIYGVQLPNKTASGWGNALSMDNVRSTAVEASGAIAWDGIYYYPADPAHYVKFCAYYPYADGVKFLLDAPSTGNAPSLRFTLNGADDILYATPVVGSRDENPASLVFNHALTQLKFRVEDVNEALTGRAIENIVIQDANTASSMNIESGVFGAWSAPAELKVPGIEGKNITLVDKNPLAVGEGIMLQPGLESFKIRLEIADHAYPDVEIKPSGELTFAAGHSYEITLTFNEKVEVFAKVVVIPWELAGTGSAVIQ